MALKLGKCRLCLKLGDFYSIFTEDNSVQLAEMVMDCTRIKVHEGDGLPDKICSECVQKLSSAYIFKQQCERSDQELRRNYVPPPGFSTPSAPNRQSSDSAFSSHTDLSNQTKPSSFNEGKAASAKKRRKRSAESIDNSSTKSNDNSFASVPKKNRKEPMKNEEKKQAMDNVSTRDESDYEDNSFNNFSPVASDSDEPVLPPEYNCDICNRSYNNAKSLALHKSWHKRHSNMESRLGSNAVVDIPIKDTSNVAEKNDEEKVSCEKCGKTFKLKIMLKRHSETCTKSSPLISPKKELLVTLEPINPDKKYACKMCPTKFKAIENLEKHMRVCHAAVLKNRDKMETPKSAKKEALENELSVPCIFCKKSFNDYYVHSAHISECSDRKELNAYECPVCQKITMKKASYLLHMKAHFEQRLENENNQTDETFDCRMCFKKLSSKGALIKHLAAHVSNIEDAGSIDDDDETRASTGSGSIRSDQAASSGSAPLKCKKCDKSFTYRKSLISHEEKNICSALVKSEPPDPNLSSSRNYADDDDFMSDDDDSQDDGDNTCDICEKMFSYKRLLIQHKRKKHNMSSGHKRAKIAIKDCKVKCLICEIEMKVSESNAHNQTHISKNLKPRNLYTCAECGDTYKSCNALASHIKLVHRLNKQVSKKYAVPDLADFCEVVVTKTEPLDTVQSHNGSEVPSGKRNKSKASSVNLSGFTCPICSKKMPTLVSLKRHVNWHSNVGNNIENKQECFVCNEQFRFKSHFKLHMREHYNDTSLDPKFLTCAICERKSKHLRAAQAHMNFHKQTRFQSQDYKCSICKRIFQHRKVYLSHMAIHYKRGESAQNIVIGTKLSKEKEKKFEGINTCPYCGKVCDSETSLKHHVIWHKSKTSLYGERHECHMCELQFTNKQRLKLHIRSHYEDENGPFKCTICGKGYTDEEYFQRHVKGHNFDNQSHQKRLAKLRANKVKCPICERYYKDLGMLIRHLRRTHPQSKMIKTDPDEPPQKVYPCKLCAKVFFDEKRFRSHEEAHLRKPEFFKCKFCGKKTISLKNHNLHIKGHLTKKYFENPLKCTECDERFTWGYDLHHHLRDVHSIKESWIGDRNPQILNGPLKDLQCSICLKVLASKGNYERHLDYHNSLRCNYCYDYFSSLRFLEGHLKFSCNKKTIIGETEPHPRKIKCEACYKAFHIGVKLDCHLLTQHGISVTKEVREGKKDIVCDYCFKVFENDYALSSHKIYHRSVGYYGCLYCDRKFNTITVYNKHKNHHFAQLYPDDPVKCEHCDEKFVAFREMIYHMRDVHGDDKDWLVLPKEATEEKCNICNKVFLNLPRHMAYHEENRCRKCSEYFLSVADYDNHLCAIDSDEEPGSNELDLRPKYEECPFCFKPFTRAGSKLMHENLHRTSGSISCRFCKLKFKTMDAFNIHAFSHRNRKYKKKPLKCRQCGEKFIKYGPFVKHLRGVHNCKLKMHYRTVVKAEACVVCGDEFPNLHNHYRAHLANRCSKCGKYFTSSRLTTLHECDKPDSDPNKVYECDVNLVQLINNYTPKDEKDDEKFHGDSEDEEDVEPAEQNNEEDGDNRSIDIEEEKFVPQVNCDDDSQQSTNCTELESEHLMPISIQSPIISEVLSLYEEREKNHDVVVDLVDEDSVDMTESFPPIITIDD